MAISSNAVAAGTACAIIALGLGFLLPTGCSREKSAEPNAENGVIVFRTPAWRELGQVLLRTEGDPPTALLLNHLTMSEVKEWLFRSGQTPASQRARRAVVYRYTPGAKKLQATNVDAWDAAAGEVSNGGSVGLPPRQRFRFEVQEHLLRHDGVAVATAGTMVITVSESPSGKYVAALSADGPLNKNQFTAAGRHYHQVFRHSDGAPVGEPVALPMSSEADWPLPHWSADDRYVVYVNKAFSKVCILATGIESEGVPQ
jgi:hypothetical protein